MKNVIKSLTFGVVLAATTSIFGQATPETCTPIYDKYIANRKGPELDKFKTAIATAKEYLEKCKDLPENDAVNNYVTKDLPKLEAKVADIEFDENVIKPFNASVPAKNWDVAFSTGKQIIAKNPDFIDVMLVLASIGFDTSSANPPVDKFNADAINMAKMALQKMNEGKPSENYGAFVYTYKTKDCPDGKTNATGWMNYTIGNIMYYRMNQKKDALPYLYKALQVGCETKTAPGFADPIYRAIGAWYIDEFRRLEGDKNKAYDELQLVKVDAPEFPAAEKKYLDLVALQKGYMERVMDAYARASKIAAGGKGTADYKNSLTNRAKEFYGFRYNKDMTGYDAWFAGISAKPFPDPTSAVTPVVEATPATGTATPGTAMTVTNDAPNTASSTDTRPRTATAGTTATKTATTPTTTAASTAKTTTTTKAPAKKPAPKKKGTR